MSQFISGTEAKIRKYKVETSENTKEESAWASLSVLPFVLFLSVAYVDYATIVYKNAWII